MKKALLLAAVLILAAGSVYGQTLKAYVLESEPLGYIENGQPKGEHYDYLKAIAERAGVNVDIEIVSKSKLFAAIKSGDIDLAVCFRTPMWDSSVEYVGLVREIRMVAVNRVGKPLNSFNDLHSSNRVGYIMNTSVSPEFDNDPDINRYACPNYETLLKTLASGRVDSGVGNAIVISYLINKLGYTDKIQSEGITLGTSEQWLQFSKNSSNLDQLRKFGDALEACKADGTLDRILDGYAGPGWRALNSVE